MAKTKKVAKKKVNHYTIDECKTEISRLNESGASKSKYCLDVEGRLKELGG